MSTAKRGSLAGLQPAPAAVPSLPARPGRLTRSGGTDSGTTDSGGTEYGSTDSGGRQGARRPASTAGSARGQAGPDPGIASGTAEVPASGAERTADLARADHQPVNPRPSAEQEPPRRGRADHHEHAYPCRRGAPAEPVPGSGGYDGRRAPPFAGTSGLTDSGPPESVVVPGESPAVAAAPGLQRASFDLASEIIRDQLVHGSGMTISLSRPNRGF